MPVPERSCPLDRIVARAEREAMTGGAEGRPRLFFQKVPEGKVVKNRLHLALSASDGKAEIDRLLSLGAKIIAEINEDGRVWTNMEDPEGNEFCVSQA
jgi:predicted enzyme related to lactoylglutathione lyase